jgi:ANTAR domain-containing protein
MTLSGRADSVDRQARWEIEPRGEHRPEGVIVDHSDLAQSLTDAGGAINASSSFDGALEAVARLAATVVPDIDHVGVMLSGRRGRVRGEVATDALARELDSLQIAGRHGPGLCALDEARVVVVQRLEHEHRWPGFTVAAAQLGVRSQVAVRLDVDAKTHGAINLYCTSRESLPQETVRAAWLYGTHAGWALRHARLRQHLEAVLDSHHLVGLACGVVMQRYRMDQEQAFSFVVRLSQTKNVKLRELARDLVDRAERDYEAPTSDAEAVGGGTPHPALARLLAAGGRGST